MPANSSHRSLRTLAAPGRLAFALLTVCLPLIASLYGQSSQDEPLRLHSDLVVLNLTVTEKSGLYAHGLTMKDFRVLEDGAPQSLESFSAEEAPFAVAIMVDMSGSMEYKFGLVRGAAASFVEQIRDNDQVAVYGFNNEVRLFQDFTNLRYITDYIWDAEARDKTRLYDCMDEAVAALDKRSERKRAILLISDGWDSSSRKASLDSALKKALSAGVTIYSVDLIEDHLLMRSGSDALSLRRGRSDMQELAARTGGRYIHSPLGEGLETAFNNVIEELRNQYTVTYYSSNNKRDGRWRNLKVSMSRPDLAARTRKGYYAPKK